MLKNIWYQLILVIFVFLLGMIIGAYVPEIKDFIRFNNGVLLLKYATWFTAFTTILFWFWQINQTRNKTEIEMALKMGEKFDSAPMVKHRIQASKALLADDKESNPSVDAILNFFEEIDFLLERRAISDEVAWNFFSYWVLYYCVATKSYREKTREGPDILGFEGIENLYGRLIKIEEKHLSKAGKFFKEITKDNVDSFLRDESIL
ncbi:MAG TPA: hypothetical protein VFQ94_02950 [Gallionella sp.]|nr:hypothetical protein [Gallionella sp.]